MLFFQVFNHGDEQLLSRAWLIDPGEVQVQAASSGQRGEKEPWNGEFYVSYGASETRLWEEAREHGFPKFDSKLGKFAIYGFPML